MDWDEVRPKQQAAALAIGTDLSGLSIAELEHRIEALQAEIARVTGELERKRAHEAAASALFKS
ncbi:MAG: DUF1192 domain-containing protein [Hyphomicrobiaceae bacterium]|nr:DUF1192 domain-containing protein [Hyphomicrobiaceae bacterium]MCC0008068.1 DUF1192 domain-containing protein [Hyphomicrobiaceae bacterium]